MRRPRLALDRLRPQRRLAAAGRAGDLADRVAAPPCPRRRTGQGLNQDAAVPAACRPRPASSPTPGARSSRCRPAGPGPVTSPPLGTDSKPPCSPADPPLITPPSPRTQVERSRTPFATVSGCTPIARATTVIPPRPSSVASAASTRRRCRSSRCGRSTAYRRPRGNGVPADQRPDHAPCALIFCGSPA